MEEIWRDVVGYEGLYKVSNFGRIWSNYANKALSPSNSKDGYKMYVLRKNGVGHITLGHRAVAMAFIPNPDNLPIINHKDENPANNNVENLEWCTYSYNNTYNNMHLKRQESSRIITYAYDKTGDLVGTFNSVREAAEWCGSSTGKISTCCTQSKYNGKNVCTVKGYVFSYVELSKEDVISRVNNIRKTPLIARSKPVAKIALDSNDVIHEYRSANSAAKDLGVSSSEVARAARGYDKGYICHGFRFKYI